MKLVFFLLLLSLPGTKLSEKEIAYRQLTWDDFRGPVPENEPSVAARTTCQLAIDIETAGDVHHFRIRAYFLPDSSFVRERTRENLRHEQTHFKIAQIEALKCNRAFEPLQGGDATDSTQALALYDMYFAEMEQVNHEFDMETDHRLDTAAERKWEAEISREMLIFSLPSKPNGRKH